MYMHKHRYRDTCMHTNLLWTHMYKAHTEELVNACLNSCAEAMDFFYFFFTSVTGSKVRLLDYYCFNDLCSVSLPSVYEVQGSYCGHAWKAVASDLNEVWCVSVSTSCLRPSGHPTPNLILNLKSLTHSLSGRSQVRNHSCKAQTRTCCVRLKTALRTKNICPWCACFLPLVNIKTV